MMSNEMATASKKIVSISEIINLNFDYYRALENNDI